MKQDQNAYEKYLSSVHDQLATPDVIIQNTVTKVTGKEFIKKEKIIAGEANEVYDLTLANQTHLIIRISRQGYPNFLQEKWAMEQAKNVEVPVPTILDISYVKNNDQDLALCLMEKISGAPLERGSIDFMSLPEDERKNYINQAGEILSRIHSVKTKGFGTIVGLGETESSTSNSLFDEINSLSEFHTSITAKNGVDNKILNRAREIVTQYKKEYAELPTFLVHGDYAHKHFMTKDKKIVGILDWGMVRSDNPVSDLAYWDYWFGHYIPTKWLIEGYQNKKLFDDNFEDLLHLIRLIKGLTVLGWYFMQKYTAGVDMAIPKLQSDIDYFK